MIDLELVLAFFRRSAICVHDTVRLYHLTLGNWTLYLFEEPNWDSERPSLGVSKLKDCNVDFN